MHDNNFPSAKATQKTRRTLSEMDPVADKMAVAATPTKPEFVSKKETKHKHHKHHKHHHRSKAKDPTPKGEAELPCKRQKDPANTDDVPPEKRPRVEQQHNPSANEGESGGNAPQSPTKDEPREKKKAPKKKHARRQREYEKEDDPEGDAKFEMKEMSAHEKKKLEKELASIEKEAKRAEAGPRHQLAGVRKVVKGGGSLPRRGAKGKAVDAIDVYSSSGAERIIAMTPAQRREKLLADCRVVLKEAMAALATCKQKTDEMLRVRYSQLVALAVTDLDKFLKAKMDPNDPDVEDQSLKEAHETTDKFNAPRLQLSDAIIGVLCRLNDLDSQCVMRLLPLVAALDQAKKPPTEKPAQAISNGM